MRIILLFLELFLSSCCKFDAPITKQVNCSFGEYTCISDVKYPVKYFYFTNNNLTDINVLKNVCVTGYLFISYNNIVDLQDLNKMSGLFGLSQLVADYNKVTKITNNTFTNFGNLRMLSLSHNQIFTIDADAFKFNKKLKYIYLECNNISNIDFVHNLPEVRPYVNLSNNSINNLNLIQINLSHVESMDLSDNNIETIESAVLLVLNTTKVDLTGNYFCCGVHKNLKNGNFANLTFDKNVACKNCSDQIINVANVTNRTGKIYDSSTNTIILCIAGVIGIIILLTIVVIKTTKYFRGTREVVEDVVPKPATKRMVQVDSVELELDEDGYLSPNEPIYEEIE